MSVLRKKKNQLHKIRMETPTYQKRKINNNFIEEKRITREKSKNFHYIQIHSLIIIYTQIENVTKINWRRMFYRGSIL